MSRTIEEKVVEMRFDNSDFERNVSQSMSTLDKLKSALNFSGAEKAFDGISSAANKLDFGPLGGAIEGVGQKFSALETMAVGALMNIGATIESKLVNTLKSVSIDQMTAGWDKYAEKTTAVQTIMNATGREIDDVSEKLATLNWFTDETSYNFTDMTNSIGKFTSQGVELEDAVTAMEGISTAAALAGQNAASASRVMYNFSQSLGMGAVKLQDWMSVENANMATEEFKQTIIDTAVELGKLDQYGNILEIKSDNYSGDGFVNIGNFRSTLSAGWFDDEVLIESMKKFGGFAGRLNEVYDQFNENYDVTTSQILSWLNEYMDGTLNIEDAVRKTGLAAEEILPILEELSSDEYELGRRAFAAAQEAKTFEDVVNATADAVSTAWMNVFENLFGNYEEAKVTWTELANELWNIFAGPISNLNDLLTDWHNMGGRDDFIQSIKNMYGAVRSVLDPIGEAWSAIFPEKTADDIFNFTRRMREFTEGLIRDEKQMGQIRVVFKDFFGLIGDFTSGFANGGGFAGFFGGIGDIIRITNDRMQNFIAGIQKVRKVITAHEEGNLSDSVFTRRMEELKEQYPVAYRLADIYGKISTTLSTVGNTLGRLFDYTVFIKDGVFSFDTILDGIVTKWAELLRGVTDVVHIWTGYDIGGTASSVLNFIRNMAEGIKNLVHNDGWKRVKENIEGIGTAFTETFGGIREFFGPAWEAAVAIFNDWLNGISSIIGDTSDDFSGFFGIINGGLEKIQDFIRNNEGFGLFVNGIKDAIAFAADFMTKFLSLTDALEVYRANGGGLVGILAVIHDKLKIILDTVFDIIQNVTGFDFHSIGDGILGVIEGVAYGILQAADTITKAFGWENNPFGKLLGIFDNGLGGEGGFSLGAAFENFGGVFQKLGEIIEKSSPLISAGIHFVSDLFKNLIELIPKIDVNTLIRIVQAIASIRLMMSATDTLDELGKTLEAYQHKLKADMLFAIAGAILMIAGAAFLIGQIDADKIGLVLGTLGTAFAGLIGTLVASKFGNAGVLAALPGAVLSLAGAMVIMAKAAGMMAGPIEAFSKIENFWESFGKLGAVMGGFLVLLGTLGAINSSGSVLGASKAIGSLATVLAAMFPIILAYSKVDAGAFAEGLKKIALALLELGGTLAVLGMLESLLNGRLGSADFGGIGNGLLKVAAALGVMVGVLFVLTKIDGAELGGALLKLAGALLALVAGFAVFSFSLAILGPVLPLLDKFSNSLLKLSIALAVVTGIAVGLGLLGKLLGDAANDIIKSGVNMIVLAIDELAARAPELAEDIVLIALAILEAVAAHTPEIVSAAVRIIGGIVEGIRDAITEGGVNLMDLFVGSGVLAGLIGFVWVLKKMNLNIGDFANAALALAGAGVLLLEIGTMFVGMGKLAELVGGVEAVRYYGEFCSAIADVFREDWGVGIMFAAIFGLVTLFSKFKLGAEGVAGAFGGIVKVLAATVGIVDILGTLFGATGALIDLIENGVGSWNGIGEGKVVEFINNAGDLFEAVSTAIGKFVGGFIGGGIQGIADGVTEKAVNVVKGLAECLLVMSEASFVSGISLFTGGPIGLAVLGSELGSLAPGFVAFADGIKDIPDNVVEKAALAAGAIGKLLEGTPKTGGVVQWLLGEQNIGLLGDRLGAFGTGLRKFSDAIIDEDGNYAINDDLVKAALATAEVVFALQEKVPRTGGLVDWIAGRQDLEKFGQNIPKLAFGLKLFASNIAGLDVAAVENSKSAAEIIMALAEGVPESTERSWFWGLFKTSDSSLATFSASLGDFGKAFYTYSVWMSKLDAASVKESNSTIKNLLSSIKKVDDIKDIKNLKTFGEKLENFGSSLYKYNETISGINSVKMNNITQAIENAIDAFVGTDDANLLGKIDTVGNKVLTEIMNLFMSEDSAKQAKTSVGVLVDYIAEKFGEDASIAKLSTKISEMVHSAFEMEGFKNTTKQAGLSLVAGIQNGITEGFDGDSGLAVEFEKKLTTLETSIASDGPTGRVKMFYDAGLKLLNGFKNGLTFADNIEAVKSAFKGFLDDLLAGITSEERVNQFKGAGETLAGAIASGTASDAAAKTLNDAGSSLAGVIVSGTQSDNVKQSLNEAGGYVAEGLANGISSTKSINNVKNSSAKLATTAINTVKEQTAIASPSKIMIMIGQFFSEGFANGIFDGIPNAKESVTSLVQAVKDEMDVNGLVSMAQNAGLNIFGNLDDTLQEYFSLHGADTYTEDLGSVADRMLTELTSGSIFAGSGEDGFYSFMNGFTDNFGGRNFKSMLGDAVGEVDSFFERYASEGAFDSGLIGAEGALEGYASVIENGELDNSVSSVTDAISGVYDDYASGGAYTSGVDTITSTLDGYMDGMEDIKPSVVSEAEAFGDAVGEAIGEHTKLSLVSSVEDLRDYFYGGMTKQEKKNTKLSLVSNVDELRDYFYDGMSDSIGRQIFNGTRSEWLASGSDWFTKEYEPSVRPVVNYNGATLRADELDAYGLSLELNGLQKDADTFYGWANQSAAQMAGFIATDLENTRNQNEQIASDLASLTEEVSGLKEQASGFRADMSEYIEQQKDFQIVMDGKQVGYVVAPYVNENLGATQVLLGRGI